MASLHTFKKKASTAAPIEYLPKEQLFVDVENIELCRVGQRDPAVRANFLRSCLRRAGGFRPELCGALLGSRRENGKVAIICGGGRLWMANEDGYTGLMPVIVLTGLSLRDEAKIFAEDAEYRKQLRGTDLFRSEIARGEREAVAINKALERLGLKITDVSSPAFLKFSHALGTLERALVIRRAVFGKSKDGTIVGAVAAVLYCCGDIDESELRKVLSSHSLTEWKRSVLRMGYRGHTRRVAPCLANTILATYNYRRRKGRVNIRDLRKVLELFGVDSSSYSPITKNTWDPPFVFGADDATKPVADWL